MAKDHDEAQQIAQKVYTSMRRRALATVIAKDEELSRLFEAMAGSIRRRLRASSFTRAQVQQILLEEFEKAFAPRLEAVQEAIRQAALRGTEADRRTFERIFGKDSGPLADASGSQPRRTRSLRLVRESEDESPSTD